jgi:hypothetical protein
MVLAMPAQGFSSAAVLLDWQAAEASRALLVKDRSASCILTPRWSALQHLS